MNTLIFDIKLYIASFESDAWVRMTIIDDQFKEYSKTEAGIKNFISLFYKMNKDKYNDIERIILEKLHSFDDEPASICNGGSRERNYFRKEHRYNDKLVYIRADGTFIYFNKGLYEILENISSPFYVDGSQQWFYFGKLHRGDDKPACIWADKTRWWFINGKRHRDGDKPAMICSDGIQAWYFNGELHRDGGKPARIWHNGTQEWWVNGKFIR